MSTLADAVGELDWYHTIALPGGVRTPGFYDTVAGADRVPLPESLEGKRCLDIASANGFWAFELERRGASEVVAIDLPSAQDLDWPGVAPPADAEHTTVARQGFDLAHGALGSSVERVDLSAYQITPQRLGEFDFVFIGNVLLHLRDPIGVLRAARSVVAGELMSVDVVSLIATLRGPRAPLATLARRKAFPWWWTPNLAAFRLYFDLAGYEVIEQGRPFFFPFGDGYYGRPSVRKLIRSPSQAWFWTVLHRLGTPTTWVRARPMPSDGA